MSKVEISHLWVEINGRSVLKDINMTFDTGERILILGESGCGKSTLLLSLLGIIQRSDNVKASGDVLVDGRSVLDMNLVDAARIFGVVFQNPNSQFCSLYPKDEVAFGLENQCVNPGDMEERIQESMDLYDFPKEKETDPINSLSGGQQQRLALSCVAAIGSEMVLMDEPTANLDPIGRMQVVDTAKKAAADAKGLMVVEHNLENWLPLLDRLVVIDADGTILCDGCVREVLATHGEIFKGKGIWRPRTYEMFRALQHKGHTFSKIPYNLEELGSEQIHPELLEEVIKDQFETSAKQKSCRSIKPVLELENVTAGYIKSRNILKGVDLRIYEGDFFALVGGNGSGKSTLSKVILNLLNLSDGTISLNGENMDEYRAHEIYEMIGYVFQNPEHQFIEDSVWAELAYSVDQYVGDENSLKRLVRGLLEDFGLEGHMDANPFSLSGGQKRRLSVATMLAGERKILILDEPTFGQDEKNTAMLMDKLHQLNQQGMTILMITHDLDLVDAYANRTAVMCDGRIIFQGDTQKLWYEEEIIGRNGLELPYRIKFLKEVRSCAHEEFQSYS